MSEEQFTPEEDDAYVRDMVRGGYSISFNGQARGWIADMDDAVRILCRAMNDAKFWPNVWYVNDHGNVTLLEITDADAGSYEFTDTAYV